MADTNLLTSCSDEDLLNRFCTGQTEAFGVLVRRYERELYGYLRRYLGDGNLAEDVFQNTFLQLYLKSGQYEPGRPVRPWLYTIATNLARDYFKSAAVRQRWRGGDEEEALLQLYDSAPGPEERALVAEQGSEVRAALAQLREEYRIVLLLRFYQGFSLQEIAETLQIPLGTVKSRLSVGVHRLRSVLAPVQKGVD